MKKREIKNSIIAIVFLFTIAGFSQNQNVTVLPLDSFSARIEIQKNPQIIDARGSEEFAINHINGSVNFIWKAKIIQNM